MAVIGGLPIGAAAVAGSAIVTIGVERTAIPTGILGSSMDSSMLSIGLAEMLSFFVLSSSFSSYWEEEEEEEEEEGIIQPTNEESIFIHFNEKIRIVFMNKGW